MQEEDFEREIKVVVVGNGGVGKTSMIRRFCKGIYTDEYKKTIGVDFLEKTLFVDSLQEDVKLMLWDTAGQEEFDSMTRTYYRGAGVAVLCFSTTDRASFESIPEWKRKVEAECGAIAMALVQNKVDLLDEAVVTREEAEALATQLGLRFYRSCVKKNLNVDEVFAYLAHLNVQKSADRLRAMSSARVAPATEIPRAPKTTSSPGGGGGFGMAGGGASSEEVRQLSLRGQSFTGGDTISLQRPARQRTKGKKRIRDKVPGDCRIL